MGGTSCLGPLSGLKAQQSLYAASNAASRDGTQTTLVLVARPDRPSLAEAERTRSELHDIGIRNVRLILNGVFHAQDRHDAIALALDARGRASLDEMPAGLRRLPRLDVPLLPFGLVGVESMRQMGADGAGADERIDAVAESPYRGESLDALSADRHAGQGVCDDHGRAVSQDDARGTHRTQLAQYGSLCCSPRPDPSAHWDAAARNDPRRSVCRIARRRKRPHTGRWRHAGQVSTRSAPRCSKKTDRHAPKIAVFSRSRHVSHGGIVRGIALRRPATRCSAAPPRRTPRSARRPSGSLEAVRVAPRLRDPLFTLGSRHAAGGHPIHEASSSSATSRAPRSRRSRGGR